MFLTSPRQPRDKNPMVPRFRSSPHSWYRPLGELRNRAAPAI